MHIVLQIFHWTWSKEKKISTCWENVVNEMNISSLDDSPWILLSNLLTNYQDIELFYVIENDQSICLAKLTRRFFLYKTFIIMLRSSTHLLMKSVHDENLLFVASIYLSYVYPILVSSINRWTRKKTSIFKWIFLQ